MSASAALVDGPGQAMHDRVDRCALQRTEWLKMATQAVRAQDGEATRRAGVAVHFEAIAAHESFPQLRAAFSAYAVAQNSVASLLQDLTSEHWQKKVVNNVEAYDKSCVTPMKAAFADREKTLLEARKANDTYTAVRLKEGRGPKLAKAEAAVQTAQRRAHNTHILFEENSQLFEYQRVTDMQTWMRQMIMSEMAFHCTAVDRLTRVLTALAEVDACLALDAVREQLVHPSITAEAYFKAATNNAAPYEGAFLQASVQAGGMRAADSQQMLEAAAQAGAAPPPPATPAPPPSAVVLAPEARAAALPGGGGAMQSPASTPHSASPSRGFLANLVQRRAVSAPRQGGSMAAPSSAGAPAPPQPINTAGDASMHAHAASTPATSAAGHAAMRQSSTLTGRPPLSIPTPMDTPAASSTSPPLRQQPSATAQVPTGDASAHTSTGAAARRFSASTAGEQQQQQQQQPASSVATLPPGAQLALDNLTIRAPGDSSNAGAPGGGGGAALASPARAESPATKASRVGSWGSAAWKRMQTSFKGGSKQDASSNSDDVGGGAAGGTPASTVAASAPSPTAGDAAGRRTPPSFAVPTTDYGPAARR